MYTNSQVSTKVGGVPEVMPDNMIKYARPDAKDLVEALSVSKRCIHAFLSFNRKTDINKTLGQTYRKFP